MGLSVSCSRRQKTWTILPLGDSITAGGALFHSYRGPLARMLQSSGFHVRWVGTQSTPGDEPQLHHEGYPGKSIEYIAANFSRLYSEDPADIILLHAGHNHTVEEHPVPGIVRSTKRILESARAINPRAIILVAQVIPSGKLPKYSYIPDLNRQLAQLCQKLSTPRSPVISVDEASQFDPRTDTIKDHVHPNERGAEKMARAWFQALGPVLR
jgi:lysophospholipase L1-like esterase